MQNSIIWLRWTGRIPFSLQSQALHTDSEIGRLFLPAKKKRETPMANCNFKQQNANTLKSLSSQHVRTP